MSGTDGTAPPGAAGDGGAGDGSAVGGPAGADAARDPKARRTPIIEGVVAEAIRRGIEAGWDRVSRGDHKGALRAVLGELRLPKEAASYIVSQLDDTKSAVLKVVAREVREFLETSRFADELARLLTTLSFEIKTEVRFVPNEDGRKLRPKIESKARLRRRKQAEG